MSGTNLQHPRTIVVRPFAPNDGNAPAASVVQAMLHRIKTLKPKAFEEITTTPSPKYEFEPSELKDIVTPTDLKVIGKHSGFSDSALVAKATGSSIRVNKVIYQKLSVKHGQLYRHLINIHFSVGNQRFNISLADRINRK